MSITVLSLNLLGFFPLLEVCDFIFRYLTQVFASFVIACSRFIRVINRPAADVSNKFISVLVFFNWFIILFFFMKLLESLTYCLSCGVCRKSTLSVCKHLQTCSVCGRSLREVTEHVR